MAFTGEFKEKFDKLIEQRLKEHHLDLSDRKNWTKDQKDWYKWIYDTQYQRIKEELRIASNDLWLNKLGSSVRTKLKELGLDACNCYVTISKKKLLELVKNYYKEVVFPTMEREMNMTGFKLISGMKPTSFNQLDFSDVHLINEESNNN